VGAYGEEATFFTGADYFLAKCEVCRAFAEKKLHPPPHRSAANPLRRRKIALYEPNYTKQCFCGV